MTRFESTYVNHNYINAKILTQNQHKKDGNMYILP